MGSERKVGRGGGRGGYIDLFMNVFFQSNGILINNGTQFGYDLK